MHIKRLFPLLASISYGILGTVSSLHAQAQECDSTQQFCNPIKASSFAELVQEITQIIATVAIPFIVVFLIYAGFLFVTARGNETKVTTARKTFFYTVIGAAIVIGAYAIATAVVDFAKQL